MFTVSRPVSVITQLCRCGLACRRLCGRLPGGSLPVWRRPLQHITPAQTFPRPPTYLVSLQRSVQYIDRSPYRRWLDQLELLLTAIGASFYEGSACYYDDSACHPGLVQWVTDPDTMNGSPLKDGLRSSRKVEKEHEDTVVTLFACSHTITVPGTSKPEPGQRSCLRAVRTPATEPSRRRHHGGRGR